MDSTTTNVTTATTAPVAAAVVVGSSNEAIYRQKWAAFVDTTIAKSLPNNAEGVEERIELRDLMRLEEVLSKVENNIGGATVERGDQGLAQDKHPRSACPKEDWDTAWPGGRDRKLPETTTDLPRLFQNPRASFLEHLLPAPHQPDRNGASIKSSRLKVEGSRQLAGLALSYSKVSADVAKEMEETVSPWLKQDGGMRDKGSPAASPPGKKEAFVFLDMGEGDTAELRGNDARDVAFGRCDFPAYENCQAAISKERRVSVWSAASALKRPSSPEIIPMMESLSLGPTTSSARESPTQYPRVDQPGNLVQDRSIDVDCSVLTVPREDKTVIDEAPETEQRGDDTFSPAGEVQSTWSPLYHDVLPLSERLDVTRIEAEEDSATEEQLSSSISQGSEGCLELTVLEVSQYGIDAEESAILRIIGECTSPLEPSSSLGNDEVTCKPATPAIIRQNRSPGELSPSLSIGSEQSLSGVGLSDAEGCVDNCPDKPSQWVSPVLGGDSPEQDKPVGSVTSASFEAFDGGLDPPPNAGREKNESYLGDIELNTDDTESPEVERCRSVSGHLNGNRESLAFEPRSWGTRVGANSRLRNDAGDSNRSLVIQSPNSSVGDRTFGSALSPAIGGFGIGVGEELSPLPHAGESFDADIADDYESDRTLGSPRTDDVSIARSTKSERTVEPSRAPPLQPKKNLVFHEEATKEENEEETYAQASPADSSLCRPAFPSREGGGSVRSDDFMPPPPSQSLDSQLKHVSQRKPGTQGKQHISGTWPRAERSKSVESVNKQSSTSAGENSYINDEEGTVDESLSESNGVHNGDREYIDEASIRSFSESDVSRSRLGNESDGVKQHTENQGRADVSLVEGTPRRGAIGPRESFAGFYAPLLVTNITGAPTKGAKFSSVQWSTLQWMVWREIEGRGGGEPREGSARGSELKNMVRGGVLGHLTSEEASACVLALIREEAPKEEKAERAGRMHARTGLPHGTTLLVAPTKDAAEKWSQTLGSGAGLSVLSYVMPLRERRRLSPQQAAAFDVVVTTYDILKAKEVPRTTRIAATSPGSSRQAPRKWHTRNTQESRKTGVHRTDHMVSMLYGVQWHRVVADGAQILANQRSARAVALLGLVGGARWCVVERENMAAVESSSERMRSLAAFIGVPSKMPLVEAAECLFYNSRPSHVAPPPPRVSAQGASLTEDDSPCTQRKRRPYTKRPRGLAVQVNGQGNLRQQRENRGSGMAKESAAPVRSCSSGSGGGRVESGSMRTDVTYTATTLCLKKSQGAGPTKIGRLTDNR